MFCSTASPPLQTCCTWVNAPERWQVSSAGRLWDEVSATSCF